MELTQILEIKQVLKLNIRKGDYVILGEMMGMARTAAHKRYERNKEDAVLAMKEIVDNRIKLISRFKGIAILDWVQTKSGSFAIVIKTDYIHFEKICKTQKDMESYAPEFIGIVLKNNAGLKKIITACSLGKIPAVKIVIAKYRVEQYQQHPRAFEIEGLMFRITAKY